MRRFDARRVVPMILAPIAALALAAGISSVILVISGQDPGAAFAAMLDYAFGENTRADVLTDVINKAIPYYLAALAVAIGFRMNLFNIGVQGQYTLGVLCAASIGSAAFLSGLPGWMIILVMMLTAMVVAAAWAGIAALLKAYRGVSEVISTIMLNYIAGSFFSFLLSTDRLGVIPPGGQTVQTRLLPEKVWLEGFALFPGSDSRTFSFITVAALAGVGYWFLLGRTTFGFDLRASGYNPFAAVASGVDARRMIIFAMLLSGALAGLVGMPELLGDTHAQSTGVIQIGFIGIGVALLGRNSPVGIAFAALLWGFLDITRNRLDLEGVPKEIVAILQGVTVLAVVIAYELAARFTRRLQQKSVGAATGEAVIVNPEIPASIAAKPGVEVDTVVADTDGPVGTTRTEEGK
jgi:simple sugar transport system permease protein